jgi:hypothetical protein
LPPFGPGERVVVRLPDGSGIVLSNVRVVRVDGRTGDQAAEADGMERFDFEGREERDDERM